MAEEPTGDRQDHWTLRCPSCRAEYTLPRATPPFGTALVCPECKSPSQSVQEDLPGCPQGWTPRQVQLIFGYHGCSVEHPRCPWCGKLVYAVVFPERGREVPWYAVRKHENPVASYAIQVQCTNCSRAFTVEWDGWPFSTELRKQCCFCGARVIGDAQYMTIPEDRRENFERDLGRKALSMAYLKDENGMPLWMACPICLMTALSAHDKEQGTDLARAYSLGPELDPYVAELLEIDQAEGLMNEGHGPPSAYDSEHRHKRGREIGEILCKSGGTDLMLRVGEAFVGRGGTEWRLSHCWHEIRDTAGEIRWLA